MRAAAFGCLAGHCSHSVDPAAVWGGAARLYTVSLTVRLHKQLHSMEIGSEISVSSVGPRCKLQVGSSDAGKATELECAGDGSKMAQLLPPLFIAHPPLETRLMGFSCRPWGLKPRFFPIAAPQATYRYLLYTAIFKPNISSIRTTMRENCRRSI